MIWALCLLAISVDTCYYKLTNKDAIVKDLVTTCKILTLDWSYYSDVFVVLRVEGPVKISVGYGSGSSTRYWTHKWTNETRAVFQMGYSNMYGQLKAFLEKPVEVGWVAGGMGTNGGMCSKVYVSTNMSLDSVEVDKDASTCLVDGLARYSLGFERNGDNSGTVYVFTDTGVKELGAGTPLTGMCGVVREASVNMPVETEDQDKTDEMVLEPFEARRWSTLRYHFGFNEDAVMNNGECTSFTKCEGLDTGEDSGSDSSSSSGSGSGNTGSSDSGNGDVEDGEQGPEKPKSNKGKVIAATVCTILLVLIVMLTLTCMYWRGQLTCCILAFQYCTHKGWKDSSSDEVDQAPQNYHDNVQKASFAVTSENGGIARFMSTHQWSGTKLPNVVVTTSSATCKSLSPAGGAWRLELPDEGKNAWVRFEFRAAPVCVESYKLRRIKNDKMSPWFWQLEGSNDGKYWELLDDRHTPPTEGEDTFECNVWTYSFFKYIRFRQTLNSERGNALHLNGIEFFGKIQGKEPRETIESPMETDELDETEETSEHY